VEREVAHRYAKALLNLATSKEQQGKRLGDLEEFLELLTKVPELKKFLLNPQINNEVKKAILEKSLKMEEELSNFILVLLKNKKFKNLVQIVREYHRMVAETYGVVEVKLISADPVSEEIKQKLKERIEASYNHKVVINERIDPSIIGGAMVIVGNRLLDFSLKRRLADLKQHLLGGMEKWR